MRLDLYLEKNDISVETFAGQIGVHRTSVYRFIKGIAFPRPMTIQRIQKVTRDQVTANDFIGLPTKRRQQPSLAAVG